jgi:hypothetical protein
MTTRRREKTLPQNWIGSERSAQYSLFYEKINSFLSLGGLLGTPKI